MIFLCKRRQIDNLRCYHITAGIHSRMMKFISRHCLHLKIASKLGCCWWKIEEYCYLHFRRAFCCCRTLFGPMWARKMVPKEKKKIKGSVYIPSLGIFMHMNCMKKKKRKTSGKKQSEFHIFFHKSGVTYINSAGIIVLVSLAKSSWLFWHKTPPVLHFFVPFFTYHLVDECWGDGVWSMYLYLLSACACWWSWFFNLVNFRGGILGHVWWEFAKFLFFFFKIKALILWNSSHHPLRNISFIIMSSLIWITICC